MKVSQEKKTLFEEGLLGMPKAKRQGENNDTREM